MNCKRCGAEFARTTNAEKYCNECKKFSKDLLSGKVHDYTKVQTCKHCGKEFTGRKRKYCSNKCCKVAHCQGETPAMSNRAKQLKCIVCSKDYEGQNNSKYCSIECRNKRKVSKAKNKRIKSYTYICKYCGVEYHPKAKDRNQYCSRQCADSAKAKKCKTCNKIITGIKGNYCSDECKDKYKEINPITQVIPVMNICILCGKEFKGNKNGKYCSDKCRYIERKSSNKYLDDLKRARNNYTPKQLKTFTCKTCGEKFKSKSGHALYCNKKCNPNFLMHRGQVSKAKRMRIWKRDKYICKLCGTKMDMSKVDTLASGNPHPLAPTADHIVPVSIAKELKWSNAMIHNENNLQAAHFICNVKRGNKAIGEQLRIC